MIRPASAASCEMSLSRLLRSQAGSLIIRMSFVVFSGRALTTVCFSRNASMAAVGSRTGASATADDLKRPNIVFLTSRVPLFLSVESTTLNSTLVTICSGIRKSDEEAFGERLVTFLLGSVIGIGRESTTRVADANYQFHRDRRF